MQVSISVIIPILRNYNNYLTEALNTIQLQSFQPKEILVIGNESNNKKIKEICKKYRNCFFYSFKKKEASAKRFFGISKANSKYIAFLDYDDLWPKNRLKYLSKKINFKHHFVVYGKQISFYIKDKKKFIIKKKEFSFLLTTSLIKKKILVNKKYFNNSNILGEYIFYKKLFFHKKKIIGLNKIVLHRRIHNNNFTNNLKTKKIIANTLKFIIKGKY